MQSHAITCNHMQSEEARHLGTESIRAPAAFEEVAAPLRHPIRRFSRRAQGGARTPSNVPRGRREGDRGGARGGTRRAVGAGVRTDPSSL